MLKTTPTLRESRATSWTPTLPPFSLQNRCFDALGWPDTPWFMMSTRVSRLTIPILLGPSLCRTLVMTEQTPLPMLVSPMIMLNELMFAGMRLMEILQCLKTFSVCVRRFIELSTPAPEMRMARKLPPLVTFATIGLLLSDLMCLRTTALCLLGRPAPRTVTGTPVLCMGKTVLLRRMSVFTQDSLRTLLNATWWTECGCPMT